MVEKNILEENKRAPLPPIRWAVHLLLKEYCLGKTREKGRLVTLGEAIEKAILDLTSAEINKKRKGD